MQEQGSMRRIKVKQTMFRGIHYHIPQYENSVDQTTHMERHSPEPLQRALGDDFDVGSVAASIGAS